jgi:antitoxin ParD1/3/4
MNLSLTPQLEVFIRECAKSGDYNNASEVVREAIRLFKRREEERLARLTQLQQAIAEGDEAVSRGESNVFNSAADLDAFFEQL